MTVMPKRLSTAFAPPPRGAVDRPVALTAPLTAWIGASETVFLEIGERLRDVHASISRVRDGITRSTELLADPEMVEMRRRLEAAIGDSQGVEELTVERTKALDILCHAIDGAASGSTALRTVFRTLDYVSLIARTQVEGMKFGQEELVPFALHVAELVTDGEKVSRYIDQRMNRLRDHLEASRAIESEARSASADARLVAGFLQLIELIERQQTSAAERRAEAHQAFTAVWKAIAGVVAGLQAHDMARQRFEHTVRNLTIFERIAAEGRFEDEGEALDPALRPAALRRIAVLETAQLADLADRYAEKMTAIRGDLGVIAGELDACGAILDRLRPRRGGSDGLATLEAEAARLSTGFRAGETLRQKLGDSLSLSVEATSSLIEMTEKLTDLEHELRIAGFNAAVRAAHIDGGDETVGYIARVIREQASLARQEADKVRGGVEIAIASTGSLSREVLPAIVSAERAIETTLTTAATLLSKTEAEGAAALDSSLGAARGLGGEVTGVQRMMETHEEGCEMMRALAAALTALAAEYPEAALPAPEAGRLDLVLFSAYTMEEERSVFAAALGSTPRPAVAESAPTAGNGDDLDDILF
ncbi:transducer, TlpC [Aureimonas endophytica]|uniref:Transducer, TlpC n=1 Tax=Aureimonas endophytica TaxID=2027858 RepID=A0A917A417_9HYPH|nr:hypothetical protein [Aureimonas endophytica]GGE25337.1 transducer, TlpC [Aureimonas endophytica]